MKTRLLDKMALLEYEIASSWWAQWLFAEWMQNLAGTYYANKTRRKYDRYLKMKAFADKLNQLES
jgi:hypothetical protein